MLEGGSPFRLRLLVARTPRDRHPDKHEHNTPRHQIGIPHGPFNDQILQIFPSGNRPPSASSRTEAEHPIPRLGEVIIHLWIGILAIEQIVFLLRRL